MLGLASRNADAGEPDEPADGSGYAFEGYRGRTGPQGRSRARRLRRLLTPAQRRRACRQSAARRERAVTSHLPALDEAFLPLAELVSELLPELPDLVDHGRRSPLAGSRAIDVTTPVELDITVAATGEVRLGGTPPLYHLATSDPVRCSTGCA